MFGQSSIKYVIVAILIFAFKQDLHAQRQMENLGRGLIAMRQSADSVYIGWRMLGTDPGDLAFNLYRQSGKGPAVKLNQAPLTESTNYIDPNAPATVTNAYYVKPLLKGVEQPASQPFKLLANVPVQQYLTIPLRTPEGYAPNDISVGDLDGDGE